MIFAYDAGARHVTYVYPGYILHQYGRTVGLSEHDILDIGDVLPLGNVVGAAIVDEPDAADIRRLLPDRDFTPADIDVGIAQSRHELRKRHVVCLKFVGVGLHFEFLGRTAEAVDLHDSRDCIEPAQHHPVLHRAQIGDPEILRSRDDVPINLPHQARLLNLRHLAARQRHVLRNAVQRLGIGKVIVHTVFERDAQER